MTIRTYKPRRGRVTPRQAAALAIDDGLVLPGDHPLDLEECFEGRPVILEIGFGTGATTAQMAADEPQTGILAIDVHTPGVGDLLHRIRSMSLPNVRVIEADALQVLQTCIAPAALAGIRSYFPDPWPKARHHKRRLVTPEHATLIGTRTRIGGQWQLATDWTPYAEMMVQTLDAHPMWQGGIVARPENRPVTRFEQTGLDHGRTVTDLCYVRTG